LTFGIIPGIAAFRKEDVVGEYLVLLAIAVVAVAAFVDGWRIGGIPGDLAEKLRRENREARNRQSFK
jgi:hypothetical protein